MRLVGTTEPGKAHYPAGGTGSDHGWNGLSCLHFHLFQVDRAQFRLDPHEAEKILSELHNRQIHALMEPGGSVIMVEQSMFEEAGMLLGKEND